MNDTTNNPGLIKIPLGGPGVSVEQLKARFQELFDKAVERLPEVRSWSKVYQIVVEGVGEFYLEIKDGKLNIVDGRHPSPIATLSMTGDVLEKILKGELDAMKAFMTRQIKISGNVLDTMNLKKIIDAGLGKEV